MEHSRRLESPGPSSTSTLTNFNPSPLNPTHASSLTLAHCLATGTPAGVGCDCGMGGTTESGTGILRLIREEGMVESDGKYCWMAVMVCCAQS
jgi:hypothetical protein